MRPTLRAARLLVLALVVTLVPLRLPAQRLAPMAVAPASSGLFDPPATCREAVAHSAIFGSVVMAGVALGLVSVFKSTAGPLKALVIGALYGGAIGAVVPLPFRPCGPLDGSWFRRPGTGIVHRSAQSPS